MKGSVSQWYVRQCKPVVCVGSVSRWYRYMRRDLGLHPRKLVRKSEHVQVVAVGVVSRGSVDIGIDSMIGIVNVTRALERFPG